MEGALSAYTCLRRKMARRYDENLVIFTQLDSPGLHILNNLCDAEVSQSIRAHNACLHEQIQLDGASDGLFAAIVYVIG